MDDLANDPVANTVADAVATTRRGSLMYSRNWFHAPWSGAFPAPSMRSEPELAGVEPIAPAVFLMPDGRSAGRRGLRRRRQLSRSD